MKASVTAHRDFTISKVDDRVYSAFLEHLGRAVYTGIREPTNPTADTNGMRGDVAELVRDVKIPSVRYPGGNFVSPTTGRTASARRTSARCGLIVSVRPRCPAADRVGGIVSALDSGHFGVLGGSADEAALD